MKIAFFGDSVTEGCFEIIRINGKLEVLRDYANCYRTYLEQKLTKTFPEKGLEFCNFGLSGRDTTEAVKVLSDLEEAKPDIVIMCFGLNDFNNRNVELFKTNLTTIYERLLSCGCKVIFMTHNMANEYVRFDMHEELREFAESCARCQQEGVVDAYVEAEKEVAAKFNVPVIDAYKTWKELNHYGIDTTSLLCNGINHPNRKMHMLFADMLYACIEKMI